ncbi:hypothetical protein CRENBAI_021997 [Crenichthys baileyi]|uniref:Uncharacterized protein n=1 Tax=Crenichthys baileyi TaxID=28760 RepID=A0AAV9S3R6_9TELE
MRSSLQISDRPKRESLRKKTSKLTEELMLLQAGLGRRTVNITEDAGHKEVTEIRCEVFPKMNQLEGAWMLYKAMDADLKEKNCCTWRRNGWPWNPTSVTPEFLSVGHRSCSHTTDRVSAKHVENHHQF